MTQPFDTPLSLLERLKENQTGAWDEFSGKYVQILKRWCASWGMQETDADDIIQETLIGVLARIPRFEHRGRGSFRAWMKTIAWRCWCDVIAKTDRLKNAELSESLRNKPEAYQSLEVDFDKLVMHELLQTSMSVVRRRVESKTWEAFQLTALDSIPSTEVAQRLGMQVDAVYAARCRVQRWITQEFKRLDGEG